MAVFYVVNPYGVPARFTDPLIVSEYITCIIPAIEDPLENPETVTEVGSAAMDGRR